MELWSFTAEQFETEIQKVLRVLLEDLKNEKKIDAKTFDDYIENVGIIIRKPSFFRKIFDGEKEDYKLTLVRRRN